MASTAIEQLWAKACPSEDSEVMALMGMTSRVGEAYKAGRITYPEAITLQTFVVKRDAELLRRQTQSDDD